MDDISSKFSEYTKKSIKNFGVGSIVSANKIKSLDIPRISSGIYTLDKALGGGWPVGRFSMVYGPESSGKTSLFLRAVANAQRTCANCGRKAKLSKKRIKTVDPNTGNFGEEVDTWFISDCECGSPRNYSIAWIDQEGVWTSEWAESLGVFIERLIISRPQYAEQSVDIIESLMYDKVADIIVIDSLAAFSSLNEIEQAAGKATQGEAARILNRAFRKWTSAFHALWREKISNKEENIIIPSVWMINQVRQKIGVMFGNPEVKPGGLGQGFVTSVEVRTSGGKNNSDYKIEDDEPSYVKLKYQCKKNKTAPAMMKGEYIIAVRDTEKHKKGDIIDYIDVFNDAVKYGIVEQISTRKFEFDEQVYSSRASLLDFWASETEVYDDVKDRLREIFF